MCTVSQRFKLMLLSTRPLQNLNTCHLLTALCLVALAFNEPRLCRQAQRSFLRVARFEAEAWLRPVLTEVAPKARWQGFQPFTQHDRPPSGEKYSAVRLASHTPATIRSFRTR